MDEQALYLEVLLLLKTDVLVRVNNVTQTYIQPFVWSTWSNLNTVTVESHIKNCLTDPV